MFSRLVAGKHRSRRGSKLRRTANFAGTRPTHYGRLSRFESLEDRRMLDAGDLDPSFGVGGIVTTNFFGSESNYADDIAVQTDGKIIAVGALTQPSSPWDFGVIRYNPDGSLDTTFGNGGRVTTTFSHFTVAHSVAIDGSGRIVVVGAISNPSTNFGLAMARYNPDGTLDTTFAQNGKLVGTGTGYWGYEVGFDASGRIIVAGATSLVPPPPTAIGPDSGRDFLLARYNDDGTIDSTFGSGGIAILDFGYGEDQATDFHVQSDGKIIVTGYARSASARDFALARFNSDGSLDTTFASGGKVQTDFGSDDGGLSLAVQVDGKLVVSGWSGTNFAVARYDSNGTPDPTFSIDGRATADFGASEYANDLVIDAVGRTTLAGFSDGNFALVRYLSDGTLDNSFGSGGLLTTDFGSASDSASAIMLDESGRMVVAGSTFNSVTLTDFALARYNSDGSLDTTFDGDGRVTTDFLSPKSDFLSDIVLDSITGKTIAVGSTGGAGGSDFALARYNSDGTLDTTFGQGGQVTTDLFGRVDKARAVVLDNAGRIVVAGISDAFESQPIALVRYNWDGTLDTTFDGDGIVFSDFGPGGVITNTLIIDGDGKIVVGGRTFNGEFYFTSGPGSAIGIARFNDDGTPDTTFGGDGSIQIEDNGTYGSGTLGLALQADGKIVAVGNTDRAPNDWDMFVARVNANGSLDTTFDGDGILFESLGTPSDSASAIAVDDNGKLVVVGGAYGMVTLRYNSDGTRDAMFNGDGMVLYSPEREVAAKDIAIQPDGKIVVGGGRNLYFATLRLNPDGTFDSGFSSDGVTFTGGVNGDAGLALALQSDGKIVTAGWTVTPTGPDFMLVRYLGDRQPSTLIGRVFDDLDNDGVYEPGDAGLEGVTVTLTGDDDQGPVNRSTMTGADGSYSFADVFAGTYTLTETQPAGLLDGNETAGSLGGTVDNTQDSNTISSIVVGNDGATATGYDFAEIRPSDVLGLVWQDSNNDGQVNFGERAIENVAIALTGSDDRGQAVNLATQTDVDGIYLFYDVRPGSYTISETQPAGYNDGKDVVGTVNGITTGSNATNDMFTGVVIALPGSVAENYNFGERPTAGGGVNAGQTATIGFWQNNNGQALIEALNGGASSIQLGNWLAATLPNMYGATAGANNLSGWNNAQVADFYSDLFRRKKKEAEQLGLGGPVKMDAQVMAVALATYVTSQTLAGTTATSFGFLVTTHGVGTTSFSVGNSGAAFGVADNSLLAVLDLLFATNANSEDGVLYDLDADGDADDSWEATLRTLANDVYSAINESGGI